VIAVELDQRLIPLLNSELAGVNNIELVHGDILDLDPAVLVDGPYKVVANLPYYITAPILRHFLEARVRPYLMVLTVQREVAERLTAKPGKMSLLAVGVQYYGRVKQVAGIKAGSFFPRPEVDSAVVRIDLDQDSPVAGPAERHFFRVVRAGFSQKRKQLRNSLRGGLGISAEQAVAALEKAGVDPRRRAETLSMEEWAVLAETSGLDQAGE
jgi:16S rRNA (adenine1518-N6/adenine1519-N6)-dimethyltransferase